MSLSVICSEHIPFITEDEIKRDTTGTFYGDHRVRTSMKACEQWPKSKVAATFSEPVKSDVPISTTFGEDSQGLCDTKHDGKDFLCGFRRVFCYICEYVV